MPCSGEGLLIYSKCQKTKLSYQKGLNMNKSVGLLAVFAFSFALHAFGENVVGNVFSSEDTRPLNDPAGWSLGSVPSSEEGAVISGGGAFLFLRYRDLVRTQLRVARHYSWAQEVCFLM